MSHFYSAEEFALLDADTILSVSAVDGGYRVDITQPVVAAPVQDTCASLWFELSGVEASEAEALPLLEQAIGLLPQSAFSERCNNALWEAMIEAEEAAPIDYGTDLEEAILEECEIAAVRQGYANEYFVVESQDADLWYPPQKEEKVYKTKSISKMTVKELDEELRDRMVSGRSVGTKSHKQVLLAIARGKEDEATYYAMLAEDKTEEIVNLEDMSAKWWTPSAVASFIKPLVDPADVKGRAYVNAPSLCAFVFRWGKKLFSQKTFRPGAWDAKWEVRLAMNDEVSGKPDLAVFA